MRRKAVILGASGYAGGELVRLVAGHPGLEIVALGADRRAGALVAEALPAAEAGATRFESVTEAAGRDADVCFSCLPSGALGPIEPGIAAPCIVDLSDEHRSAPDWVYGLVEHARDKVAGARRVANPGCYPTAVLLAAVPLMRAGLVEGPLIVDAVSGTSGAGRALSEELSFSEMHGGARAYGLIPHRHVSEMERAVEELTGQTMAVSFTPHLVPMARGLLATVRAHLVGGASDGALLGALREAYEEETFVSVIDGWPTTKSVTGSNRAVVSARADSSAGFAVMSCAIDNLGKGAAGQAIQNANLALGLDEAAGLPSIGIWP